MSNRVGRAASRQMSPRARAVQPSDGIAWITGGATGIGAALVAQLVADGWTVAITSRSEDKLAALAARFPAGRVIAAAADVTDENAVRAAVRTATATTSRPVALAILNAGTWHPMGAADFSLDKFRDSIETNLIGTGTALAAVMPGMMERRRGQIAITSSVAGYFGMPKNVAYGLTKAGLINLAESLRLELRPYGVMANLICPGFVRTPMTDVNEFPMPFMVEPDYAAREIVRGLRAGRFEIVFPPQMAIGMKIVRALPYALFFAAVGATTARALKR